MGGLVLSLLLGGFSLPIVVFASALFTVCSTFFGPGSQALLPELVPAEQVDVANGIFESTESVAGIAGSAAAGVLVVVVGAIPSLGIDALSYLVGAALIALITTGAVAKQSTSPCSSIFREVRAGFSYLARRVGLLQLTLVGLVTNFLFSIVLTFLVVYTSGTLHGSALVYGGLEGLLAAGWGVGGLLVGRLLLTRFTGRVAALTGLVDGGVVLGLVLAPVVVVALPLVLLVGIWQGVLSVTWLSAVQSAMPRELQGRYMATDNAISYAAIPASQVLGGFLILTVGLPHTFLLVSVRSLASSLGVLSLRRLRAVGYDPRQPRVTNLS